MILQHSEFILLQTKISTPRVIDIIFKKFKKLKDFPVSERELKKVKEYLKGGIILSLFENHN